MFDDRFFRGDFLKIRSQSSIVTRLTKKKKCFFEIGIPILRKPGKVDGGLVKLVYHYYQKYANKLDNFYKRENKRGIVYL